MKGCLDGCVVDCKMISTVCVLSRSSVVSWLSSLIVSF